MDWDGKIDRELDCEGLLCPLPVLRAGKVLDIYPHEGGVSHQLHGR